MSNLWVLDDMPRVALEREKIQELAGTADWLVDPVWSIAEQGLALSATIIAHGRAFPVRMVYPARFPAIPPVVYPQNINERWSEHQYQDGALCLEWGPDTWRPEITGGDVLESAHRLLLIEKDPSAPEPQVAPSRHKLSLGQSVRHAPLRFFVSNALAARLRQARPGVSWVHFSYHRQAKSFLLVVERIVDPSGVEWIDEGVPIGLRHKRDSDLLEHAMLVHLPTEELGECNSVATLDAVLAANALPTLTETQARMSAGKEAAACVCDSRGRPSFFLRLSAASEELCTPKVVTQGLSPESRLSPELAALGGKSVGLVGAGSVGSKIAVSLARTGVGHLVLVDHDVFVPENVVRHALDLRNTAELKVEALAQLIGNIAPTARVDVRRLHLTGQESNADVAEAIQHLCECDVIIDATADPRVFSILADAAQGYEKPLIWLEVFGGSLGGMLARSRPGKDASPFIIRDTYHAYTAEHPAEQEPTAGTYGTIDDTGAVLVATDADVSVMAAHATQLVLDSICDREQSRFPHALYLVGMARGWVFDAPFHTIAIETPAPLPKSKAGRKEPVRDDVIDFLSVLFEEADVTRRTSP